MGGRSICQQHGVSLCKITALASKSRNRSNYRQCIVLKGPSQLVRKTQAGEAGPDADDSHEALVVNGILTTRVHCSQLD